MLYILNDGTIRLTRGDTARLTVPIHNDLDDSTYTMAEDDILAFTIKRTVNDTAPLVSKKSVGINTFHILPEDTKELKFGSYKYDVQLTTVAGDVYTIIEPTTFEVLTEVT